MLCNGIREQLEPGPGDEDACRLGTQRSREDAASPQLPRRHRTEYRATFWTEAGRKESAERDFVYMYQLLFGVRMTAGEEEERVQTRMSRLGVSHVIASYL